MSKLNFNRIFLKYGKKHDKKVNGYWNSINKRLPTSPNKKYAHKF